MEFPDYIRSRIPESRETDFKNMRNEQILLRGQVILEDSLDLSRVKYVGGADVSFFDDHTACAGIVVLELPKLSFLEFQFEIYELLIPYVPTFLAYRELPGLNLVYNKLETKPDLLFFDGNGIIHPLGIGIASHFGVQNNMPTIGVAKKLLLGTYQKDNLRQKGDFSYIYDEDKIVGAALLVKDNCKPVFISQGHLIELKSAIRYALQCSLQHIPEPVLLADKMTREIVREKK